MERIKDNIEASIFDESITDIKRAQLVIKRNTINNFIELPDDLIQEEVIKEGNSAPSIL